MLTEDRRTRKRMALRQTISDVATGLFMERGFDAVTVDDIAEAADVGRKTVFNHFAQKEDMFFDFDAQGHLDIREAISARRRDVGLVETMRLFAHQVVAEDRPYLRFFPGSEKFMATAAASKALRARAREIRDELARTVATAFTEAVGRDPGDVEAKLAATLLMASWTAAFLEAHRAYHQTHDAEEAKRILLHIIDRSARGLETTMRGSPYV